MISTFLNNSNFSLAYNGLFRRSIELKKKQSKITVNTVEKSKLTEVRNIKNTDSGSEDNDSASKSSNFWGSLGKWVKDKVDCCLE